MRYEIKSSSIPVGLACSPGCHGVRVNVIPGVLILLPAVPFSPDYLGDAAVEVREILCGPRAELLGVANAKQP